MLIKKIWNKGTLIFRQQQEYRLGKYILKTNAHAAPDFMIIGTPKSGTTSLFQYIAQHPAIIPPTQKELFYFSTKQRHGLKWYLQHFPLKAEKNKALTFEASPSYLYYTRGLERIKRLLPKVKLIVILRDPVARAYSQWNFHRDSPFYDDKPNSKENRPFKTAVEEELNSDLPPHPYFQYINKSLYAKHLNVLYNMFHVNQILLLDFEDLKNKPQDTLKQVTKFLDITNIYNEYTSTGKKVESLLLTKDADNTNDLKVYNVFKYKERMDKETEDFLRKYFKPYDEELQQLTGRKFSWMQ